jgi:hypothetical protein
MVPGSAWPNSGEALGGGSGEAVSIAAGMARAVPVEAGSGMVQTGHKWHSNCRGDLFQALKRV